jgi:8-oxo-dGTP pyrophosphatase MutT (NUDIX family)
MNPQFELLVRALIIRDRKILVCQTVGRDYFFLPGGHVEFSETLRVALRRELYEELGAIVKGAEFIGGVENIFQQDGQARHEISFVFQTEIDLKEVVSKEDHVNFFWFTMDQFVDANIVPPAMKDAIIQWTAEKETFFIEEKMPKP